MPNENNLHQMGVVNTNRTIKIFCSECEFSTIAAQKSDEEVLHEHEAYRERTSAFASGKEWAQKNIVDGPGYRGSLSLSARTDLEASFNNGLHAVLMESKFRTSFESSHIDGLDELTWERI